MFRLTCEVHWITPDKRRYRPSVLVFRRHVNGLSDDSTDQRVHSNLDCSGIGHPPVFLAHGGRTATTENREKTWFPSEDRSERACIPAVKHAATI